MSLPWESGHGLRVREITRGAFKNWNLNFSPNPLVQFNRWISVHFKIRTRCDSDANGCLGNNTEGKAAHFPWLSASPSSGATPTTVSSIPASLSGFLSLLDKDPCDEVAPTWIIEEKQTRQKSGKDLCRHFKKENTQRNAYIKRRSTSLPMRKMLIKTNVGQHCHSQEGL